MSNVVDMHTGTTLSVTRAARRHKVFLPSTVLRTSGEERVHILDISRSGARTFGAGAVVVGEMLELAVGEVRVAARVRWVNDRSYGLEFDPAVDQSLIDRLLSR